MVTNARIFRLALLLAAMIFWIPTLEAQNRVQFAGEYNALDYAFGLVPGSPALVVNGGPYTAGTVTITVQFGCTTTGAGTTFCPLAIDAPITLGATTNAETVTPTAVSCTTPAVYASCTFTAVTANTHGQGEPITTGSYGVQEAANVAMLNGGGLVIVDRNWAKMGGTTSTITSAVLTGVYAGLGAAGGFSPTVTIQDNRLLPITYWAPRPTTKSLIAAGAALTLSQIAGGSLTSSGNYYVTYEYVDPLGGISLAATDSSQIALTGSNQTITTTAPVAATGAVGWIPMITANNGATGTEIEVPITTTVCAGATASLVSTAKVVCPLASTATISANPSSTSKEVAESTAHTTFAPQQFFRIPPPFQEQYGPFVVGGTINSTGEDLAQFYTPPGFFNYLGQAWRVCVKGATATQVGTSIMQLRLGAAKQYGQSPVYVSTINFPTYTQAAAGTFGGCWELQTDTTGSSGKMWSVTPQMFFNVLNSVPGTLTSTSFDVSTNAGSAFDLTSGLYWSVNMQETNGANITGPIVNALSILPVN